MAFVVGAHQLHGPERAVCDLEHARYQYGVKVKMKTLLLLAALLTFTFPAIAKEPIRTLEGIVVKVSDGDTITVNSDGTKVKVRLYGIDAPERRKRTEGQEQSVN